jgi:hypothetical protein
MRTIKTAIAVACCVVACAVVTAAGPANASTITTTADSGTGPTALCVQGQEFCDYNSGWITYEGNQCEADTVVDFNTFANTMTVSVEVYSPYLFASCTAVSTVNFQLYDYPLTFSSAGFWGFACAKWDSTCTAPHADPGTWVYSSAATGIPAEFNGGISGIWVTDTT